MSDYVTINKIEVASKLAHSITFRESGDICNNEDEMFEDIYADVLTYNEVIQERFDTWFDYFLTLIEKEKIS